ncbi:MAG: tetratricopeptide repeat protein [Pseudomonadota bacterium]
MKRSSFAALLASALALPSFAQDVPAQEGPQNRFTKQVEGPELPGPIARPEKGANPKPTLDEIGDENHKPDLAYGAYQKGFYLTALDLALPRAESGDPAAQTLIAELYWKGLGVAKNRDEGARWYEFAAQAGDREAQFAFGNILLRGTVVPEDKTRGEAFLKKAAEQGHARAAFNLAQIMTARRPTWAGFKRALPFYKQAANANIADAQYALANIHAEAKGVTFNDDKTARQWLAKAAANGLDTAQVDYGIWLANGRGGPKDAVEARNWFQKAAAQGNRVAQNRLARVFAFGVGVKADPIRGGAWHIVSRRAGFSDSEMDQRFQAMSPIDQKRVLEAANQLTRRIGS